MQDYAELRCRTHYSFLRGASSPEELIQSAGVLGLRGLAITDLDGVYAIPKAYRAVREQKSLQLLVGTELTLEGRPPLTLLAMNRAGYGLMCRLITASRAGKAKPKPHERAGISWERFLELTESFSQASEGLIVLADTETQAVIPGQLEILKEIFDDRLYLPLTRHLDGQDPERLRRVLEFSRRLEIEVVATNEVHYHHPDRRKLQDTLTAIRENVSLDQAGRELFSNSERYLKSPAMMRKLFKDFPEALDQTIAISERCLFSPSELRYRYPSEWIPEGESAQSYLERLTWEGARRRYANLPCGIPLNVVKQLRHELGLIRELQFADYFLTIWEIVEFARRRDILCQGRGSAANSAVCYCLGITAIDPVRMNLLFERFISAERGEPPDIDVDFEHERREEVIQHIYNKYGRDRAGMVSAIITYREKSAIRDVSKALALEPAAIASSQQAAKLTEEILGFPRHLSIHSGGFTLSADPIIETVPIEPARMEGRTIVQWDKEDLATLGLLKVDILALGMLTALHKTMNLVNSRASLVPGAGFHPLTLATVPAEDTKTYQMIQRADTVGVFQIESRAQMSMLRRLLPRTFYDLVVQVAIVRPGPIVGEMVHPYLRRRRGLEPSLSPDPRLEPILGRTLGVPLFQEQVMKMAITMAGFTPGEADELRRAIGAWRSSGTIEKMGIKLRDGLLRSGLPAEFVQRVFQQIQGFAEYGFPESHAASFALLAYASSYLKCHYPAEFTCALINSQPMGFYSVSTLIEDAKHHGVKILPLNPNFSEWDCTVVKEGAGMALRVGWRVVQGLGERATLKIIEERTKAAFVSLQDFLGRTALPMSVLHRLAIGDAFESFGLDRRQALWAILGFWARKREQYAPQLDLFTLPEVLAAALAPTSRFKELSPWQAIQADHSVYGLSVQGHPMGALRKELGHKIPALKSMSSQKLRREPAGRNVRVVGMVIIRQRPPTAKGTAFATLEDEGGFIDLILRKEIMDKYKPVFLENAFLVVSGRVQRDGEMVNVIVNELRGLFEVESLR